MSTTSTTTPVASAATTTTTTASISTVTPLSYFLHHILLLVIVVGLAVGGFYTFENQLQKHDLAEEAKYSSLLANQTKQNQDLQMEMTEQEAHYQQIQQMLTAQNEQLIKTIATLNQKTQTQVKQDATLDAQQAAEHISQQTNAKSGEVVAQNNNVVMDLPISRSVTSDLDLLVGTQSELVDTQTQLKNETTIATNLQTQSTQQTAVISGLQKQNTEQVAACTAEVAALKKQNRKSKIKAFFIGAGTVVVAILGHAL